MSVDSGLRRRSSGILRHGGAGASPFGPRLATAGSKAAAVVRRRDLRTFRDLGAEAPAGGPTLEFLDVGHEYESLRVLGGVSLAVQRGEFIAVVGPSGCGKSTLVRIAAGLVEPSFGTVEILGEPPPAACKRRAVGIVFQEPALIPWRNTLQNVTLASEVVGLDKPSRESRARQLLAQVGLEDFEGFAPSKLSGGMKQRAAIARALMLDPQVLLLDEPFGALDQITRERLQSDFASRWDLADVTVLLVTHNVEEAVFMADRVVVLTPAPARIAEVIEVPVQRPRPDDFRSQTSFFSLCCAVREALDRVCTDPRAAGSGCEAPA